MRFKATVPASSANLGPGFDTLALALSLYCQVEATPAPEWSIDHVGPEPYRGEPEDDAVLRAARQVGGQPLRIEVFNRIPLCSGLGSSAAAYAAGTLVALRAEGRDPSHDQLFEQVRHLEGHPDNAAAAVYGGLVAVVEGEVVPLTLAPELVPVLAVPGFELRTSEARRVVPSQVSVEVVVRTLGRIAVLVEGLRTGSAQLLEKAAGDELHEKPRAELDPRVAEIIERAWQAGAHYVCWSGSGPSVLSLFEQPLSAPVAQQLQHSLAPGGRVLVLDLDTDGAR